MSKISPFAIHKTLIGIGGELKSVKRLCSGDLLIETTSALQTESFLLAKSFLNNPVTCQRFGRSQTACRGQLTCSRCASLGHASSDCTLEQKCVNCSQPHSADSKLFPKWKIEKEIQKLKSTKIYPILKPENL
ncbi:uncharacterized protein TNCV_3416241 [Trichonephila clavipes]|nr:uncharacterized protein TNCV_3416241 [Trichonephila clavipes]